MYDRYKKHFLEVYESSPVKYRTFPHHVDVVAKWADKLCDLHPEADRDVAVIASWFHDLGHFLGEDGDHAVISEKAAKEFLEQEDLTDEKKQGILHAVRAHRNRDVEPKTIEAKIVCCADSASHLTAEVYLNVLSDTSKEVTLGKLERDYRDLSEFPEIKEELTPLYQAWKDVINSFPEDFIKDIPKG
jgi:HD superfamily phosphohydrolase YqeK